MEPYPRTVKCSKCQTEIGQLVDFGGIDWLNVGSVVVRTLNGACGRCGEPLHWSTSDRMLSELVGRVLELRHSIDC